MRNVTVFAFKLEADGVNTMSLVWFGVFKALTSEQVPQMRCARRADDFCSTRAVFFFSLADSILDICPEARPTAAAVKFHI